MRAESFSLLVNDLLARIGIKLSRAHYSRRVPGKTFRAQLRALKHHDRAFRIVRHPTYDVGDHPESYIDFECEFAATHIGRLRPSAILDIGSYRLFLIGLSAGFKVTTLDIRAREPRSRNETVLTGDAKSLPVPPASFDCIVSLCSIEHFGLGRYGDDFDPNADISAGSEMARVLRPGGRLILSTAVTRGPATIAFNAHRIYDVQSVRALLPGLLPEHEAFFDHRIGPCFQSQLPDTIGKWGVYCGLWRKP